METFQYFFRHESDLPPGIGVSNSSPTHYICLLVALFIMASMVLAYQRFQEPARRRTMKILVLTILALELSWSVWMAAVGHYVFRLMLPLHLCEIMIFVELLAVYTGKRFFKELSYCSGLPGALLALAMPEPGGYPLLSYKYLLSYVIHILIALVPLLWVTADGFRPNMKYLPQCFAWLCGFTIFDAVIDSLLKTNYMFLCIAPKETLIEVFDRWVGHPWYVGLLLLTVGVVWTLMFLPWEIGAAIKGRKDVSQGVGMS